MARRILQTFGTFSDPLFQLMRVVFELLFEQFAFGHVPGDTVLSNGSPVFKDQSAVHLKVLDFAGFRHHAKLDGLNQPIAVFHGVFKPRLHTLAIFRVNVVKNRRAEHFIRGVAKRDFACWIDAQKFALWIQRIDDVGNVVHEHLQTGLCLFKLLLQMLLLQRLMNRCLDAMNFERFEDKIVCTVFDSRHCLIHRAMCRKNDERHLPVHGFDLFQDIQPAHLWHV